MKTFAPALLCLCLFTACGGTLSSPPDTTDASTADAADAPDVADRDAIADATDAVDAPSCGWQCLPWLDAGTAYINTCTGAAGTCAVEESRCGGVCELDGGTSQP